MNMRIAFASAALVAPLLLSGCGTSGTHCHSAAATPLTVDLVAQSKPVKPKKSKKKVHVHIHRHYYAPKPVKTVHHYHYNTNHNHCG